jgi:hypothetical protein
MSTTAGMQSLGRHRTGDEEMLVGFRPAETARGFHGAAGRSIGAGVYMWVGGAPPLARRALGDRSMQECGRRTARAGQRQRRRLLPAMNGGHGEV